MLLQQLPAALQAVVADHPTGKFGEGLGKDALAAIALQDPFVDACIGQHLHADLPDAGGAGFLLDLRFPFGEALPPALLSKGRGSKMPNAAANVTSPAENLIHVLRS